MSSTTDTDLFDERPEDAAQESAGQDGSAQDGGGAIHGNGWYARKTRETRAFLSQLRPDEDGELPGYSWSRRRRRRSSRSRSGWSKFWRSVRDAYYRFTSPLP